MSEAEFHEQLEENEREWMEQISPPPVPINSTIFCVMAMRNGQLYAAPLGTHHTT